MAVAAGSGCFYPPAYDEAPRRARSGYYGKSSYRSSYYRPASYEYRYRTPRKPRYERRRKSKWSGENAGPRMGALHVTGEAVEILETEFEADPTMTVWGWQFELQYNGDSDGPIGLVEFVPLVAGLEQGQAFPSMNLLMGIRLPSDWEFCAGPNLSPGGVGMTVAIGRTFRIGEMSMPINVAAVGNDLGYRYSITFGWNLPQ
jgi:hypothetical protein